MRNENHSRPVVQILGFKIEDSSSFQFRFDLSTGDNGDIMVLSSALLLNAYDTIMLGRSKDIRSPLLPPEIPTPFRERPVLRLVKLLLPKRRVSNSQITGNALVNDRENDIAISMPQPHVEHSVHFLPAWGI